MLKTIPTKQEYNVQLVQHLLEIGTLRVLDGHLVSARKLIDESAFFETEDIICNEWLHGIYDSYYFYDGFDTLEACAAYIFKCIYNPQDFKIVKFFDMYYAVCYVNSQHQQIIGKEVKYFSKNKLFLVSDHVPLNLTIKPRPRLPVIPIIYHELYCFDQQICAYHLKEESPEQFVPVEEIQEAMPHFVLLGVTFKDQWFPCNTPHAIVHSRSILNMYFNEGHDFTLFGKYANAVAINPFQHLVCFAKGRVEHYQMDIDDRKTPFRKLPYREAKRFHDFKRIRPVNDHANMTSLI